MWAVSEQVGIGGCPNYRHTGLDQGGADGDEENEDVTGEHGEDSSKSEERERGLLDKELEVSWD